MKLSIISDLHLERDTRVKVTNQEKSDTIVLAGDVGDGHGTETIQFVKDCCDHYENVIYILGNHEIYGPSIYGDSRIDYAYDFYELLERWRELAEYLPNLHFLHNEHCIINGKKFIASVLFSDITTDLTESEAQYMASIQGFTPELLFDVDKAGKYPVLINTKPYDELPRPEGRGF